MTFSVRALLSAATLAVLLLVSAAVGGWSSVSTRDVLEQGWKQQVEGLAERTNGQVSLFLAGARPSVELAAARLERGELDPTDHEAVLEFTTATLLAYPEHTWFTWSSAEGTLAATLWWPDEGGGRSLRRDLRVQRPEGGTLERVWELHGERWELVEEKESDYDPRERAWFQHIAPTLGAWTDAYAYVSRGQPGISYGRPSRDPRGALQGIWTADFECGPISEYLAGLDIGDAGKAYIVDGAGKVLGDPGGVLTRDGELIDAAEHPDAWLRSAWAAGPGAFADDNLVGARQPIDASVDWTLLVVLPQAELYGPARRAERNMASFTALLLLVALGVALAFAGRLSATLGAVTEQMQHIARFDLNEVELDDAGSVLREVRSMAQAHDHMKHGLRSFARYVPQQLVEQLMRSGEEARLGGEERVVTVLFCDIAGFTTLVEANEPDRVMAELTTLMTELDLIIEGMGGTVVQYLGDAILAVWGAPAEMEDHAEQATRAAVRMRARVAELVAEAEQEGRPVLRLRIGLHTGPCIVGNIGSDERFSYTVLGPTLGVAERIQDANKEHGTVLLLSPETASRVRLPTRPVGPWFTA